MVNFAEAIELLLKEGDTDEIIYVGVFLFRPVLVVLFAVL